MVDKDKAPPSCFGHLEQVFPMGADGLRHSPEDCMQCNLKTDCLRTALGARAGLQAKLEMTDRAYKAGAIGFLQRWSRKKSIDRKAREVRQKDATGNRQPL